MKKIFTPFTIYLLLLVYITILSCFLLNVEANYKGSNSGDLRTDLNLEGCRIVQEEDEHVKKGQGSIYAYDVACIRGQSFDVYSPSWFTLYVVEKIGYDERLGNFLVLRHGELRFVYGHTVATLKEGTSVSGGEKLGITDKSGMSENYHLHIELWKEKENVSFSYIFGKGLYINERSEEIRIQRGLLNDKEINTKILAFISNYEGLNLKAYSDGDGRWSIGYGTKSYKGEVITKEEAENRARLFIQEKRELYSLYNYPLNVQIAVSSFIYNIGSLTTEQQRKLENGFYKALANDFKQWVKFNGEIAGGLVKRRGAEEVLLINL